MYKKLFYYLSLAIFLAGCATTNAPDPYEPKKFSTGQKGVAILRITQHTPQSFNKTDIGLEFNFKKIGEDKTYHVEGNNSFLPGIYNEHDYYSCIMMLDPGVYYIDFLRLRDPGNLLRWYPSPGVHPIANEGSKKYLVRMGAFEVKAGKVSYFGYLTLPPYGKLPFKVINETEKAKSDLRKKGLEELANKLEFQPFYHQGSVVIQAKGKNSFITREEMEKRINHQLDAITN